MIRDILTWYAGMALGWAIGVLFCLALEIWHTYRHETKAKADDH